MAVDTGNGASLSAFSVAMSVRSMTLGSFTRETIDTSHLGTTNFMTSIPGDLAETPEVEVTVLFDPTDDTVGHALIYGAAGTATVSFPDQGNGSATLSGSAYVTNVTYPELANNTLQEATISFKYDGNTGPTFTAETA